MSTKLLSAALNEGANITGDFAKKLLKLGGETSRYLRKNSPEDGDFDWSEIPAVDIPNLNASKINDGTFDIARLPTATDGEESSTKVVRANDSRISDERSRHITNGEADPDDGDGDNEDIYLQYEA